MAGMSSDRPVHHHPGDVLIFLNSTWRQNVKASRYTKALTALGLLLSFLLGSLFEAFKVWHMGGLGAGYRRGQCPQSVERS